MIFFCSFLQQIFSFFCNVMLDNAMIPIHLLLSSTMLLRGFKVLCFCGSMALMALILFFVVP